MIPYSYNMVDMGGIDLAEANCTVVPGVYEKIVEAMNLCGDLILYNWKFAGINIAPSAYNVLQQVGSILINGLIQVTELDQITVIGLPPPLVPVSPLNADHNGIYEAVPPASGFNPVTVAVSASPLEADHNGIYEATPPAVGFNPVSVNVPDNSMLSTEDETICVQLNSELHKIVWYFNGFEKVAQDVTVPSDLISPPTGLVYSKAYDSDGVTQIGWIGFYQNKIRSWNIQTSQTKAGTFWGVVYMDGGSAQDNPYVNPYQ